MRFETQRPLFNKRACSLWIAGAFLLLSSVGVVRFLASAPVSFRDPEPVKERTKVSEPRVMAAGIPNTQSEPLDLP